MTLTSGLRRYLESDARIYRIDKPHALTRYRVRRFGPRQQLSCDGESVTRVVSYFVLPHKAVASPRDMAFRPTSNTIAGPYISG